MSKLLSTTQCAERKKVSRQAVAAAIKRGDIPAQKAGRSYVIAEEDCDCWKPDFGQAERGRKGSKSSELEDETGSEEEENGVTGDV